MHYTNHYMFDRIDHNDFLKMKNILLKNKNELNTLISCY